MRSFPRYILRSRRRIVLAGSAGFAALQSKVGAPRDWRPNDVDFFVEDAQGTQRITDAYVDGELKPLGCKRWDQTTQLFYYDDSNDAHDGDAETLDDAEVPAGAAEAHEQPPHLVRTRSPDGDDVGYDALQTVLVRPVARKCLARDLRIDSPC